VFACSHIQITRKRYPPTDIKAPTFRVGTFVVDGSVARTRCQPNRAPFAETVSDGGDRDTAHLFQCSKLRIRLHQNGHIVVAVFPIFLSVISEVRRGWRSWKG